MNKLFRLATMIYGTNKNQIFSWHTPGLTLDFLSHKQLTFRRVYSRCGMQNYVWGKNRLHTTTIPTMFLHIIVMTFAHIGCIYK